MQNKVKDQYKLLFLGAGNIASAIIKGLIYSGFSTENISVYDSDTSKTALLSKEHKINVVEEIVSFENGYVFICVKPNDYSNLVGQIRSSMSKDVSILSCMAGVPLSKIQEDFKDNECLRLMPNVLIESGNGFTAVVSESKVLIDDLKKIFNGASSISEMPEDMFNLITGASGSGPAWFYEFINSYIKAVQEVGFNREDARAIALSLLRGVAEKVNDDTDLDNLISQVASPGGTTQAGLTVFEHNRIKKILRKTINEAAKRSQELLEENK